MNLLILIQSISMFSKLHNDDGDHEIVCNNAVVVHLFCRYYKFRRCEARQRESSVPWYRSTVAASVVFLPSMKTVDKQAVTSAIRSRGSKSGGHIRWDAALPHQSRTDTHATCLSYR